jgi:hypothetical protein
LALAPLPVLARLKFDIGPFAGSALRQFLSSVGASSQAALAAAFA